MNLNVKVDGRVALLAVALAVIAVGVKVWADGQVLAIGGPAQLLRAPSGDIYIQVQNHLLQHSAQGAFKRRFDLAAVGVESLIGGIAFYPNGDILIRRGSDPRSLYDKLRAYARLASGRSIVSSSPGEGLVRCNVTSLACAPFGDPVPDFRATFHAFIDASTGSVYVSDTSRHTLRRFSAAGKETSSVANGVRFPNQLLLYEGRLLVADTNNHRIAVFDLNGEELLRESASFDVEPDEARSRGERWPTHFARVAEHWWVNNMRSDMRNGGVYVFDSDWTFVKRLRLPEGADPIAILPYGPGALISDWENDRIYRVDADGQLVGEFTSSGLRELLQESMERRGFYRVVSWLGIALLAMVLAGLLVKGLSAPASPTHRAAPEPEPVEPPADWVWFRPDPVVVRKLRATARTAALAVTALIAALVVLAIASAQWLILLGLALPVTGLAAITASLYWMSAALLRTRIGLRGKHIALRDHRGRESRSPLHRVVYSDSAIATPEMAVVLGGPHKSLYDRHQLEKNLVPYLDAAKKLTDWQMQLKLIRLHRPTTVLLGLVLITCAVTLVAYLTASWTVFPAGP